MIKEKIATVEQLICPYCQKAFIKTKHGQKFCSSNCCRKYNKVFDKVYPSTGEVLRKFICKACGSLVLVRDKGDKRKIFCSVTCSRRWFRHPKKSSTIIRKEADV